MIIRFGGPTSYGTLVAPYEIQFSLDFVLDLSPAPSESGFYLGGSLADLVSAASNGFLAMDAPPGSKIFIVGAVTSQGGPTSPLIRSKIKQIEYRQCNDGTGEPKTENVARIVPCDGVQDGYTAKMLRQVRGPRHWR
jgi:hypothetical protein